MNIRKATPDDARAISDIYNHYIEKTAVTFETVSVSETEMRQRIGEVIDAGYLFYVGEADGRVIGYYYTHRWHSRCAYNTTVEESIYLDKDETGKGYGTQLMVHLLEHIDKAATHVLIAGICVPNEGSVCLHEKFGFKQISYMKEIGRKFDEWRDVGHWQLTIDQPKETLTPSTESSCCSRKAEGYLRKEWLPKGKPDMKELVKQRYNDLAVLDKASIGCCCNPMVPAQPSKKVFTLMSEDYSQLKGYEPDADLGVGCGLPTQYARIQKGDTVVDLGSGAGNDCFIAREETGENGRVFGIDFAPQMLAKARANAARRGFANIEFLEGDIENMPLSDKTADVVVSNCVLNLLPRKDRIFKEIYRVLKPGGHFCISDVVLDGVFPKEFTDNAAMYAGCIASAIQREEYVGEIEKAQFSDIKVERTKTITIPDEVLQEHLDAATIAKYKAGNVGIYSITVTGVRPE